MSPKLRAASIAAVILSLGGFAAEAVPSFAWAGDIAPEIKPVTADKAAANSTIASADPAAQTDQADDLKPTKIARQVATKVSSLRELVAETDISAPLDQQEECLAGAVYFESRSEPLEGQHAVADVVINRSESGRFPRSLCGVVYQPSQFSFVRGGRMPAINRNSTDWREAVAIARIARADAWKSAAPHALFFHATRVNPGWRLKRIATVGNHIFYR